MQQRDGHFNYNTGEVSCKDDKTGGGYLWTLPISKKDQERCGELFERYPRDGHWEYKYAAYLRQQSFWEAYLSGEVTVEALQIMSEEEMQESFL